jgi:hypothetical protein
MMAQELFFKLPVSKLKEQENNTIIQFYESEWSGFRAQA